jgi:glutamate racemase
VSESSAPVGVFDSGIGGLTVVREIERQLPHERIIYFGDTARVPYGPKSPETVQRYSREISDWLVGEGVKAIVVACNTATAHALPMLREYLTVPVIGVVEPGARAAMRSTTSNVVGVIGTAGTIASGAYERAIHAIEPRAMVIARACPLFVPLVEEGWIDRDATRLIAREYLEPLAEAQVDTIVLGCTHYPLLAPLLAKIALPGVQLIDSAAETAAETRRTLIQRNLCAESSNGAPMHRFVASDDPDHFLRVGQRFLGSAIDRVEKVTLG